MYPPCPFRQRSRGHSVTVLALVSKEHVYVEGPPGAAKTLLAERTAELTRLRPFVYQMHRDTRLHEIVGDAVIIRSREPDGSEVIRQSTRPGGILSAQIAVLDDISRAPGEALNVLLRLLNERKYHDKPIPLLSAGASPRLEPTHRPHHSTGRRSCPSL